MQSYSLHTSSVYAVHIDGGSLWLWPSDIAGCRGAAQHAASPKWYFKRPNRDSTKPRRTDQSWCGQAPRAPYASYVLLGKRCSRRLVWQPFFHCRIRRGLQPRLEHNPTVRETTAGLAHPFSRSRSCAMRPQPGQALCQHVALLVRSCSGAHVRIRQRPATVGYWSNQASYQPCPAGLRSTCRGRRTCATASSQQDSHPQDAQPQAPSEARR